MTAVRSPWDGEQSLFCRECWSFLSDAGYLDGGFFSMLGVVRGGRRARCGASGKRGLRMWSCGQLADAEAQHGGSGCHPREPPPPDSFYKPPCFLAPLPLLSVLAVHWLAV